MARASSPTGKMKRQDSQEEEEYLTEPLDLQRISVCTKDKTTRMVSALSIGFMERREYVAYVALPSLILVTKKSCSSADEEEWIQRMTYLAADLSWLLKLPHYRFWSQIVYDEDLQKCLQTYLSFAPRTHEINFTAQPELLEHQNEVHKLVFRVFLRMCTYKESKLHHITPSAFGDIIYDNFIFDIPRIMDLCVLYGFQNQAIVSKMVNNLFSTQTKFLDDLDEACSTIMIAFDSVEEQLQNLGQENTMMSDLVNEGLSTPLNSTLLLGLLDIVNYVTDISATLFMFLECFPKSSSIFLKYGASTRIPHFYDSVLMEIENEVQGCEAIGQDWILDISASRLALTKTFFIRTFRNILCGCIQAALNAKFADTQDSSHMIHIESYLQVIAEIIIGTVFKCDYNRLFPIQEDLELFSKAGIALDPQKINYILESLGYEKHFLNTNQVFSAVTTQDAAPKTLPANKSITNLQDLAASLSLNNLEAKAATPSKPKECEILSQIHYVNDLFAKLGEGFIEECLAHYDYDPAKVVDAVLSETLPEHLKGLDRTMKRKVPKNNIPNDGGVESLLSERKSVFDNDEFDVFNREDVPMERIRFGKTNKTPKVYELLNDAKDSALLKELTLKFGENDSTSKYEQSADLYDDEYDDTYDSVEVSVPEREAEDELLSIRPFTVPRVLNTHNKRENRKKNQESSRNQEDEEEEEEATEEDSQTTEKPRETKGDFCENPELARQRYQQRQETRQQNRNHAPNKKTGDSGSRSSFQNKERHKGSAANHNRRKQSDFKRSRGMMPS